MEINNGGIGKVNYPLISDLDKSVARAYDVLLGAEPATVMTHDDEVETSIGGGVTMRGSFLIDEDGTVVGVWRKVKAKGHAEMLKNLVEE